MLGKHVFLFHCPLSVYMRRTKFHSKGCRSLTQYLHTRKPVSPHSNHTIISILYPTVNVHFACYIYIYIYICLYEWVTWNTVHANERLVSHSSHCWYHQMGIVIFVRETPILCIYRKYRMLFKKIKLVKKMEQKSCFIQLDIFPIVQA